MFRERERRRAARQIDAGHLRLLERFGRIPTQAEVVAVLEEDDCDQTPHGRKMRHITASLMLVGIDAAYRRWLAE